MRTGKGRTGRPIGFDKDAALEAAMLLFWERGYEGASIADLTCVMNLNASSIYAAFGDKHALFSKAIQRYLETRGGYFTDALAKPTLAETLRALFENTVNFLTSPGHPSTCMTLGSAMGCGLTATPSRDLLTGIRLENEVALRSRFVAARKQGDFPESVNLDDFTRYVSMLLAGLSVQAANGSGRRELRRTARLALKCLGASMPEAVPFP